MTSAASAKSAQESKASGPELIKAILQSKGPIGVHAPRGSSLNAKGWVQEAALRMLLNNLDKEVAERPEDLVVYGGSGKGNGGWVEAREAGGRIVGTMLLPPLSTLMLEFVPAVESDAGR